MLSLTSEHNQKIATLSTFFAWKRTPKVTDLDAQLLTVIGHPKSPIYQLSEPLLIAILSFLAPSPEEYAAILTNNKLSIMMRISREISKETVLDYFLGQLHGCYSLCYQAYTNDPNDAAQYWSNYKQANQYFIFIMEHYSSWIMASTAPKELQNKYINYLNVAEDCFNNKCSPPHPTSSLRNKFPELFRPRIDNIRTSLTRSHSFP